MFDALRGWVSHLCWKFVDYPLRSAYKLLRLSKTAWIPNLIVLSCVVLLAWDAAQKLDGGTSWLIREWPRGAFWLTIVLAATKPALDLLHSLVDAHSALGGADPAASSDRLAEVAMAGAGHASYSLRKSARQSVSSRREQLADVCCTSIARAFAPHLRVQADLCVSVFEVREKEPPRRIGFGPIGTDERMYPKKAAVSKEHHGQVAECIGRSMNGRNGESVLVFEDLAFDQLLSNRIRRCGTYVNVGCEFLCPVTRLRVTPAAGPDESIEVEVDAGDGRVDYVVSVYFKRRRMLSRRKASLYVRQVKVLMGPLLQFDAENESALVASGNG
jgi:hypothetical protein